MASTNKTAHYDLSQFTGSDKPAWLGDYNADMAKIDNGINTAQTTATGADGKADTAVTSVGALTDLQTTNKTSAVNAINEVKTLADTAQNSANNGVTLAGEAKTLANGIVSYLNLNQIKNIPASDMTWTNGSIDPASSIKAVHNIDGTLGKIYGTLILTPSMRGNTEININVDSGLRPTEEITITGAGLVYPNAVEARLIVQTNGRLKVAFYVSSDIVGQNTQVYLTPCLYFMQNFGDTL